MPRRLLLICPCTAPVVGSGSRFSRADLEAISRNHEVEAVYLSRFSSPHLLKPRLPAARSGAGTSSVRAPVEDSCCSAVEFRRETPQQRGRRLVGSRAARACALGSGTARPRRGTRRVALRRRRTAAQAGATACGNRNRKGSAHAGAGIARKLFRMFQFHARRRASEAKYTRIARRLALRVLHTWCAICAFCESPLCKHSSHLQ